MTARTIQSPYYTKAEVCELLKISPRTLDRMIREKASKPGELTRVKLDPSKPRSPVRLLRAEVDAICPSTKRARSVFA